MPEFDENIPEDEDTVFEPDPGRIAFLDQEEARFAEVADEFEQYYGFKHECHCGEDYAAGRVVEIPLCYANLLGEAMEACRELKQQRDLYLQVAEALHSRLEELMDGDEQEGPETGEGAEVNAKSPDSGTGNGSDLGPMGTETDTDGN